jgi:hypothetical protein
MSRHGSLHGCAAVLLVATLAAAVALAAGCNSNASKIIKDSYAAMSRLKTVEWQVNSTTNVQGKTSKGSVRFFQVSAPQGKDPSWKVEGTRSGIAFEMYSVAGKRYLYTQGNWTVDSSPASSSNPLGFLDAGQLANAQDVKLVKEDDRYYTISYSFDNSHGEQTPLLLGPSDTSAQPALTSTYVVTIDKKTDYMTREDMTSMVSRDKAVVGKQISDATVIAVDPPITIDLPPQAAHAVPLNPSQ